MSKKWIKAAEGIRYREHAERKNGIGFDRYYVIYFRQAGKQVEQALGWGSKGVTLDFAKRTLVELKNNYITASGPVTLKEKRQQKTDALAEQDRQQAIDARKNITFKDFFESEYLPIQKTVKSYSVWVKEEQHGKNWIFPVVGDIPIKDVSSFHVERIKKNLLEAGRAPRTIEYVFATIRQTWNQAHRAGIVSVDSPTKFVKIPKFDNKRERFLTADECNRLLNELKSRSETTYRLAVVSLDAGLRLSEIAGLQWQDVDVIRESILLRDTKNHKNRTVFMTQRLKSLFSGMPKGAPDSLVFPDRNGNQIKHISKTFDETVADLGLNNGIDDARLKAVFHSLRHTHCSRLLESGADIFQVSKMIGHCNVQTTMRYAHIRADGMRNAIRNMEQAHEQTAKIIPMVKQAS